MTRDRHATAPPRDRPATRPPHDATAPTRPQEALAELVLQPLPVAELREGGAVLPPSAVPVPPAALSKFRFALKPQKSHSLVWSTKGLDLVREDLSIWAAEIDATPLQKRSRARLSLGHCAVAGVDPPTAKSGKAPINLEVSASAA